MKGFVHAGQEVKRLRRFEDFKKLDDLADGTFIYYSPADVNYALCSKFLPDCRRNISFSLYKGGVLIPRDAGQIIISAVGDTFTRYLNRAHKRFREHYVFDAEGEALWAISGYRKAEVSGAAEGSSKRIIVADIPARMAQDARKFMECLCEVASKVKARRGRR